MYEGFALEVANALNPDKTKTKTMTEVAVEVTKALNFVKTKTKTEMMYVQSNFA